MLNLLAPTGQSSRGPQVRGGTVKFTYRSPYTHHNTLPSLHLYSWCVLPPFSIPVSLRLSLKPHSLLTHTVDLSPTSLHVQNAEMSLYNTIHSYFPHLLQSPSILRTANPKRLTKPMPDPQTPYSPLYGPGFSLSRQRLPKVEHERFSFQKKTNLELIDPTDLGKDR